MVSGTTAFVALPSSQAIPFGTSSINLSGTVAAGSAYPPSGETVTITINGASQPASIGANGVFSATFSTAAIPASATAYPITYSYAGDTNFASVSNSSTTLTVNPLATLVSGAVQLLGTGIGNVTDNQVRNQLQRIERNHDGYLRGQLSGRNGGHVHREPDRANHVWRLGRRLCQLRDFLDLLGARELRVLVDGEFCSAAKVGGTHIPCGPDPPPQEAIFNCPSNTNPCTDPNAHALQLLRFRT